MRNILKLFGIIALAAVTGFSMTSCATGSGIESAAEPKIAKDPRIFNVGDEGPSRGYIFFAENGRYLECSFVIDGVGRVNWEAAQNAVKNYRGGRFSDWRLPTIDELELIYNNLRLQSIGGFNLDRFWSSEQDEDNEDYVKVINFLDGTLEAVRKTDTYSVRAVRVFEN
jgi:hypothetical protein